MRRRKRTPIWFYQAIGFRILKLSTDSKSYNLRVYAKCLDLLPLTHLLSVADAALLARYENGSITVFPSQVTIRQL